MKNLFLLILITNSMFWANAQNNTSVIEGSPFMPMLEAMASQKFAREMPNYIFGYWESKEYGMYFYADALVLFSLPAYDASPPIHFMRTFVGSLQTGDTLKLNLFDRILKKETISGFRFIDEKHLQMIDPGSSGQYFEKKELNLYAILSICEFLDEITHAGKTPWKEIQAKFERIENIPPEIQGLYENERDNEAYFIFDKQINENNQVYSIQELYKFDNLYVIVAPLGYRNTPNIFLIKEPLKDQTEYIFKHIGLHSTWKNNPRPKSYVKKDGRVIALNELPQGLFKRYFPYNERIYKYHFESFIQLKKEGTIFINGTDWKVERIYSTTFRQRESKGADTQTYYLSLEIENMDTGQGNIITLGRSRGGILFYHTSGLEFYEYRNFQSVIGNILLQILGIIAVLVAVFFVFYRLVLLPRKLKQRLTQVQLEGIKSQLNPHFLFNSMASIQSLMNQGKIEEANKYQSELSDLLRYHLDAGAEDMVLLSEEVTALHHYCELENLRSPFSFSFEIDEDINPETCEIPNQLLQPLVENAIKHGLRYSNDPRLLIRVQKLKESMVIHIIDNGPGISATKKLNKKGFALRKTHKGLALIKEKISILKTKGLKLNLQVVDLKEENGPNETGTQVSLELPLMY